MPALLERRIQLPPDPRSPGRARRMLAGWLDEVGADDVLDTAVLLASELCENAVLHAGTEFEVELHANPDKIVITVSDRGSGPLELHLAQPRRRYGRAATHGRGLVMVQRLAAAWGTCHESDGTHRIWFALARGAAAPATALNPAALNPTTLNPTTLDPTASSHTAAVPGASSHSAASATTSSADETSVDETSLAAAGAPTSSLAAPSAAVSSVEPERLRSIAERARWLLHIPAALVDRLQPTELVAELVRRLRDVLDAELVAVEVDESDGAGAREVARDGVAPADPTGQATVLEVRLPTTGPLRGTLRVLGGGSAGEAGTEDRDLVELAAHRIAMSVEGQWLRTVDQHRRSWMAYLADTSELLGQTLDVDLAVAVVPQVVVPRLGLWCAVHLLDAGGRLGLAALTHADENELPELTAALDPSHPGELRTRLRELVNDAVASVRFAVPTDGVAVAVRARGVMIGTLSVGRPGDRSHTPEDVVLIGDIARRAGLAIHNAQSTAAHVAVSHALQQALLPRALPVVPAVEFAADYLPASAGSDVGGDFYDVLTIDPTRWLLSMGDVCGKGARAAARTGQVRDVLRVLVRDGNSLPRTVDLLNDVMMDAGDPLQFATVAAAVVARARPGQPAGLTVDLVLAGHLQPVLVHADGDAELIGEFGTAVGLVERVQVECTRHRIAPGDTLLLYTDGVTERRRGDDQFGSDRLLAAARSAAGGTAAQLVAAVRSAVERFSADAHDDIALLAVRAAAP